MRHIELPNHKCGYHLARTIPRLSHSLGKPRKRARPFKQCATKLRNSLLKTPFTGGKRRDRTERQG